MLPIIYGVVIFIGLAIMIIKLRTGHWISLFIDIGVFWFVFKLHGGTMSGAFAATIAAMLSGLVFPLLFRGMFK
jgi:hypothetical protein